MKKKTRQDDQSVSDANRRDFIKKSTLAGAGVAAAATLPTATMAGEIEPETETKKQKGYQLTEHVLEYYKSAAS